MKIVVGISGASGAIYADQLLSFLREHTDHEVFIVPSTNGTQIFLTERGKALEAFGYPLVSPRDFSVPFVSGSSPFDTLVIVPCSMGTLGRIAHGVSEDVLTRTADVFLKERKKMILVPRETPLSLIHLENMRLLTLAGVTILPANPSYYSGPKTLEEAAQTVTARILDHMGIQNKLAGRWQEEMDS